MRRTQGDKAISILDTIDLEIWQILKKKRSTIGEISLKAKMQHKTLKPHLDKMYKIGFIDKSKEKNTRRIFYSISPSDEIFEKIVEILNKLDKIEGGTGQRWSIAESLRK